MEIQSLCPDPSIWRIVLISPHKYQIIIHLEPHQKEAHCPICGTLSQRVHSHYLRHPFDLSWSGWPVQLWIICRRFFCDCPDCPRSIFSESFPEVLKYYAHRTYRLQTLLLEIAHASSAEGAARLAKALGYPISSDALLHLQRQETLVIQEPRAIGLDEFSLRKSPYINYGTLIVDLDRHRPIEVLDSDQVEPVAEWLKSHPGIKIITRDRDESYATAGRLAAPSAIQVADRFHLVRNAGEVLKRLFRSQSWKMPHLDPKLIPTPHKIALWEEANKRRSEGESRQTIATGLGLCTATVSRYLTQDRPPTRTPRLIHTKIGPFLSYLQQRREEGCYGTRQLYEEIIKMGYQGKLTKVFMALRHLREGQDLPKPPPPLLRWLLRPSCTLKPEEHQDLNQILLLNPTLAEGYSLKEQFVEIIHQGAISDLYQWLKDAASCGLKYFERMAYGVQKDLEAVINALVLPQSNAQCEGQICRVKLIKRAGYGRAKTDLLRKRVLHHLTPIQQLQS